MERTRRAAESITSPTVVPDGNDEPEGRADRMIRSVGLRSLGSRPSPAYRAGPGEPSGRNRAIRLPRRAVSGHTRRDESRPPRQPPRAGAVRAQLSAAEGVGTVNRAPTRTILPGSRTLRRDGGGPSTGILADPGISGWGVRRAPPRGGVSAARGGEAPPRQQAHGSREADGGAARGSAAGAGVAGPYAPAAVDGSSVHQRGRSGRRPAFLQRRINAARRWERS